jgi:magnesium transporter
MLKAYASQEGRPLADLGADDAAIAKAQWIDLFEPTEEEKAQVLRATGFTIASEDDLDEIETSSRLSYDGHAIYMSMPLTIAANGPHPHSKPVGFVLSQERLITIRFLDSRAFRAFLEEQHRTPMDDAGPVGIFLTILEGIVEKLADLLETTRDELDRVSRTIFMHDPESGKRPGRQDRELQLTIKTIGRAGDLMSHVRDSLLGIDRILPFVTQAGDAWINRTHKERMKSLRRDVTSLTDYDNSLNNKMQFLLDATLGLINTAQNNIIKVLTVVSVVGVPPTLVASIYGMNFKDMPELNWAFGYPYGLTLIVLSAVLPLLWFRFRGWL